jgi:transposase InsO family protein
MVLDRSTLSYQSRRDPQAALRVRLRELAASRGRFGYRRLTVMLRREGWGVNAKRIYRLYTEDGLAVRTKVRKKIARRSDGCNDQAVCGLGAPRFLLHLTKEKHRHVMEVHSCENPQSHQE